MTRLGNVFSAAAMLGGVALVGLTPALAQPGPGSANGPAQMSEHQHDRARMMPSQLVDGRIAFLKTELKITPAQETQWQQLASAMRQNAQAMDQTIVTAREHRGGALNAVQRIELRAQFAKIHADNETRLLDALRPLYASLSPEQQQMANQLMAKDGWRHHGPHHA